MRPLVDRRAPSRPERTENENLPVPEKPIPAPGRERRREPRVVGQQVVVVQWTDSDGTRRAERARIADRSKKGLGLRMAAPIPAGTEVGLSGGTTALALVRHCRLDGDAYVVGLLRLAADRRAADRIPVEGAGKLIWHNSERDEQAVNVQVRDSSRNGLQIESPREIPVPFIVRLLGEGVEVVAETRYCSPITDGFKVGLRFVRFPEDSPSEE